MAKDIQFSQFCEHDSLLDGITFEDLIITLQSNERVIDEEAVKRVFEDLVRANLKDACFLLKEKMQFILDSAEDR